MSNIKQHTFLPFQILTLGTGEINVNIYTNKVK